jgi:HEAT repeat protein
MHMRPAVIIAATLFALVSACVQADPPALRSLVTVVATQPGQPANEATQKLVAYGRPALVVVEAALHTADPAGRRRLIQVVARIHDPDARALLEHFARYDENSEVRSSAARAAASL